MVERAEARKLGLIQSFACAFQGVRCAWTEERNFRIQSCHLGLVLLLSAWLQPDRLSVALVLFGALVLLAAEMANSALERSVDLVTGDFHPLAKSAKDLAAGAVMLVSLGSGIVTLTVFFPLLELGSWLGLSAAIISVLIARGS